MRAKRKYTFQPDYAVLPGDTLREVMESLEMTQKELAVRTGLTVQTLIRIFKGEQPISYESANRLELATGVPARFWNNLETQYQEQKAKLDERSRLETDLGWLKTGCCRFVGSGDEKGALEWSHEMAEPAEGDDITFLTRQRRG